MMDFDFDKCYTITKSIWEELDLDEKKIHRMKMNLSRD